MDTVFVTRVRGNFKNVVDRTFDSNLVAIAGENGTGKTSILNNIELALTGSVQDVAGRDAISNTRTLRHFVSHDSEEPLFAEVWLSDGSHIRWEDDDGSVRWKRPEVPWVDLYGTVISTMFTAKTTTGGFRNGIEFLYEHFVVDTDLDIDPPEQDPETLDRFVDFVRQHATLDRVPRLLEVVRSAEHAAKQHKRQGDALARAIEVLVEHVPDANVLPFLKDEASAAREAQEACFKVAGFGRDWMGKIVQKAALRIETVINKFAPASMPIGLWITDSDFMLGMRRDGVDTMIGPSGAQTTAVAAAVAAAAAASVSQRALIVLPDRYFSEAVIRDIMTAVEDTDACLFFQIGKTPRGRPRAGWHYVFTSE